MFTGLVLERGRLTSDPEPSGQGGVRLVIAHSETLGARLEVGSSLAVAGVCLTLVAKSASSSSVELAPETLRRTTLGALTALSQVNLEPALRLGDALGGHWVQGHVDATTEVLARQDFTAHRELDFALPPALAAQVVEKGSIAIDGVSLTLAALEHDRFRIALIPHTLEVTTLGALVPGALVNLETDVLGKYVERALASAGWSRRAEAGEAR